MGRCTRAGLRTRVLRDRAPGFCGPSAFPASIIAVGFRPPRPNGIPMAAVAVSRCLGPRVWRETSTPPVLGKETLAPSSRFSPRARLSLPSTLIESAFASRYSLFARRKLNESLAKIERGVSLFALRSSPDSEEPRFCGQRRRKSHSGNKPGLDGRMMSFWRIANSGIKRPTPPTEGGMGHPYSGEERTAK